MSRSLLLIAASALVTLESTATIAAAATIGVDLQLSLREQQWMLNAPLLLLAALVISGGSWADRYGRRQVLCLGLGVFAVGSAATALATHALALVFARSLQGAAAALILPCVVARLRECSAEPREYAVRLGLSAAVTGGAAAIGPLLGGGLADIGAWRSIFVLVAGIAAATAAGAWTMRCAEASKHEPTEGPTGTQVLLLATMMGAVALVLVESGRGLLTLNLAGGTLALAISGAALRATVRYAGGPRPILPDAVVAAPGCLRANAATFGIYFSVFGVPFLLVLYQQQTLGYGALRAGLSVMPLSLMLASAGWFGRLAGSARESRLVWGGALAVVLGALWLALDPLGRWSHLIPGTALVGLGAAMSASALTHAAVGSVPERHAGLAAGLHHAVVRAAGLTAIALLGAIAARGDHLHAEGVARALCLCAALAGAGGVAFVVRTWHPRALTRGIGERGTRVSDRAESGFA